MDGCGEASQEIVFASQISDFRSQISEFPSESLDQEDYEGSIAVFEGRI
jgi:hypothetical protein